MKHASKIKMEIKIKIKLWLIYIIILLINKKGVDGFTWPTFKASPYQNDVSKSLFWTDQAIFPGHPRFKSLTKNIRERRGEKVCINVPLYIDQNTPEPMIEKIDEEKIDEESSKAIKPNHIYLDAVCYLIYLILIRFF